MIFSFPSLCLPIAEVKKPMTPWSAMTGEKTHHTYTLDRFVDAPRYFYVSNDHNPLPVQEMDRIEFCYRGKDMHVAQAICQQVGGGNADNLDYPTSTSYVYEKSYANGAIKVQLAELICPKMTKDIKNCAINILTGIEKCVQMRVRCLKRPGCYKPNNFVWSKKYNR